MNKEYYAIKNYMQKDLIITHLKEKRKWHPLVIAVKYFFLIIIAKPALGNFGSNMFTYGYQNIFLVI